MIYEYCVYTMPNPMRIREMLNVIEACMPFYDKHGMRVVGVWSTGKQLGTNMNQVIYALEFDDYRDLESRWAALRGDPEWQAEEMRVTGGDFSFIQSVEHFTMTAAPFSPVIPHSLSTATGGDESGTHLFEFKTFTAPHAGKVGDLLKTVEASLPYFARHDFHPVGIWTTSQAISSNGNRVSFMLKWRDLGHYQDGWAAMRNDDEWENVARELSGGDISSMHQVSNYFMAAAPFSPLR